MEVTIQNVTSNKAKCVDFINLQVTRAENAPRMSFFRILITDIVKNLVLLQINCFMNSNFVTFLNGSLRQSKLGSYAYLKNIFEVSNKGYQRIQFHTE